MEILISQAKSGNICIFETARKQFSDFRHFVLVDTMFRREKAVSFLIIRILQLYSKLIVKIVFLAAEIKYVFLLTLSTCTVHTYIVHIDRAAET